MSKGTNAKAENSDTILNDVRSALLNVGNDITALGKDITDVIEKFQSIKEVLDDMLQKELGYNQNLRQTQLKQAMLALNGTDDLQGVHTLDGINKKILERQEKLAKLRAQVAVITGEGGTQLQKESLNHQITILNKQNALTQSVVQELLKGTMINGQTQGIDTNKLIQATRAIELSLKELQSLNDELKNINRIDISRPRLR